MTDITLLGDGEIQKPVICVVGHPPATPFYKRFHESLRQAVLAGEIEVIWMRTHAPKDGKIFSLPDEIKDGDVLEDYLYAELDFDFEAEGNPGSKRRENDPDYKNFGMHLNKSKTPVAVIETQTSREFTMRQLKLYFKGEVTTKKMFRDPVTSRVERVMYANVQSDLSLRTAHPFENSENNAVKLPWLGSNACYSVLIEPAKRNPDFLRQLLKDRTDILSAEICDARGARENFPEYAVDLDPLEPLVQKYVTGEELSAEELEQLTARTKPHLLSVAASSISVNSSRERSTTPKSFIEKEIDFKSFESVELLNQHLQRFLEVAAIKAAESSLSESRLADVDVETLPDAINAEVQTLREQIAQERFTLSELKRALGEGRSELSRIHHLISTREAIVDAREKQLAEQIAFFESNVNKKQRRTDIFIHQIGEVLSEILLHSDFANIPDIEQEQLEKEQLAQNDRFAKATSMLETENELLINIASKVRAKTPLNLYDAATMLITQKVYEILGLRDRLLVLEPEDATNAMLISYAHPNNADQKNWFYGLEKLVSPEVGNVLFASVVGSVELPSTPQELSRMGLLPELLDELIARDPHLQLLANPAEKPTSQLYSSHNGTSGGPQDIIEVNELQVKPTPVPFDMA